MNAKFTSETRDYRANQLHLDDLMRTVQQERLAQLADGTKQRHNALIDAIHRVRQAFAPDRVNTVRRHNRRSMSFR